MINLFFDTRKLDALARENYELSEEIMMENAAGALESEVMAHAFSQSGTYMHRPTVLILAGKGNNGADGYALARRLICHEIAVFVFECIYILLTICIFLHNNFCHKMTHA